MKKNFLTTGVSAALATAVLAYPAIAVNWINMGRASSGESIFVDSDSIRSQPGGIDFRYRIGNETIDATAYCEGNKWYADGYGWYSPQSQATQDMFNYVCNARRNSSGQTWLNMGSASTGETIWVNWYSMVMTDRGVDFQYRIGSESIAATADCSRNRWYAEGFGWYSPQSRATQGMIDFVCHASANPQQRTAVVFDPPSNVRAYPNGDIICSVRQQNTINLYGNDGEWYYTDACGSIGMIHQSQIR
ncbi:hypothetical protein [Geitlerinema sp. PCC 9228]|jgi:hypothetical protein|uniref:hypothetical protein n=1 Tax=Geitlerinema sp. PCC 9228 TaxID=111611 RepID=UPI001B8D6ED4|nr:hypothetical protein [Geitlerinema sp. PCC 9228]